MLKLRIGSHRARRSARSSTAWPPPPITRPSRGRVARRGPRRPGARRPDLIDDKVKEYVVNIGLRHARAGGLPARPRAAHQYGASPRATLYLTLAAKADAFLQGRGYVTPQDVKSIGPDVLRHRVIVTYEAEAEEVDAGTRSSAASSTASPSPERAAPAAC